MCQKQKIKKTLWLIYYQFTQAFPCPTLQNWPESRCLVTLIDYKVCKKRSNLRQMYVKIREGGRRGRKMKGQGRGRKKGEGFIAYCVPSFVLLSLHVLSYLIFP